MRISVIAPQYPDSLGRNLCFTLRQMGHIVQEIDQQALVGTAWLRPRFRRVLALAEMHPFLPSIRDRALVRKLLGFAPDLVINTFADWGVESVAKARSKLGAQTKIVFLYPDPTANLGRDYPLVAEYDALFFKDPYAVELFTSRLGISAHYLPEACNPTWHYPAELSTKDIVRYGCDITTACNMYYYRARILEQFVDYDMKLWGTSYPSWLKSPLRAKYPGIRVAETEKAKAFQAAKIVVNTMTHKEVAGVNARTFEAAGCGAFQIADFRPAMLDLFKPDEEIVLFHTRDELKEKVDYYLQRPEARKRIAEAGYRRAHADHTYRQRLEQVIKTAMKDR